VLTGADINAGLRARALARFAVLGTGDEIDRYRVVTEDLARDRARVEDLRERQAVAVEETAAVADRLDTELAEMIAQLEEAEAQEAIFQQEVARLEEEERRRLEEERRRRLEEERRRREAEEAARRATSTTAAPATTIAGGGDSDDNGGDDTGGTDAPATTVPTPDLVSGGGLLCPVGGPTVFTDSWGAARSGGRGHKGVDMFAERGTPAVAPVSGTVVHRDNSVGGKSYWLFGDDGHSYYGTHLDAYVQDGVVAAGTVIGLVGNTGNARNSSPHLHFEVHPNGGAAVNPYPYARAACG
jgi:murein DD-endopeptidase MepM/ murein hydrolase activator NlpD